MIELAIILAVMGALCSGIQLGNATLPPDQRGPKKKQQRTSDLLLLGTLLFGGAALALLMLGGVQP